MQPRQPLSLNMLLPSGVHPDDAIALMAALAAFLCIMAIWMSFNKSDRYASKIKQIQQRREDLKRDFTSAKKRKKSDMHVSFMRGVAMKLQLVKKNQIGKTQTDLIQAGLRSKDAIYVLAFFNLLLPIIFGFVGFFIMGMNSDVSPKWKMMNYIWPVLGAYIGLKLPWYFVRKKKKARNHRIQRSLPDVLDLMTICAEAGLSLVAMLDRVSRELRMSYPEMAEELALTSIEIGFLPDRNKALLNLSDRCGLQDLRGVVSVLIQTEKYGTPIAQALRVLSQEFRQSRMLRAEQKAAQLPAVMTLPMIIFILPTLFIVIIAPAAVRFADSGL